MNTNCSVSLHVSHGFSCIHPALGPIPWNVTTRWFADLQKNQNKCVTLLSACFTPSGLVCLQAYGCVSTPDEKKENKGRKREGARRRPYRKKKGQSSGSTCFLGWPFLPALGERRDTLTASCSPGLAPHLLRWSFLAGAAIFISLHGKHLSER